MPRRPRRNHTPVFKSKVALATIQGDKTVAELSQQFDVHANQDGIEVGRKHVATLMKRMGIEALYRKPKTTKKHPQHRVYPYLLRGLVIDRPNQVFAMDITYIPMARGFVYLVAVLDRYSRKVLSWRVSITMDGKGSWRDNVFIERLWRSVKYQVYYSQQPLTLAA